MMAKNFLDLIKDIKLHIQEAQQALSIINTKISTHFETHPQTVERQRVFRAAKKKGDSSCTRDL